MATVGTYLYFHRITEEVFNFYKSVFGGEFGGNGISRYKDIPPQDGAPPLPEAEKNLVMHVELPLPGGHSLLGTDSLESMGFKVNAGIMFRYVLNLIHWKKQKDFSIHYLMVG